jgi:hypothetical protein
MACTACLVCFISTVNGRSNKKKKRKEEAYPWKAGARSDVEGAAEKVSKSIYFLKSIHNKNTYLIIDI